MKCPEGHDSTATDYCDTCGAPMTGTSPSSASPTPRVGTSSVDASPTGAPSFGVGDHGIGESSRTVGGSGEPSAGSRAATQTCPNCAADNAADNLFCEVCGFDFTTGVMPRVEGGEPSYLDLPDPVRPSPDPSRSPADEAGIGDVATGGPSAPVLGLDVSDMEAAGGADSFAEPVDATPAGVLPSGDTASGDAASGDAASGDTHSRGEGSTAPGRPSRSENSQPGTSPGDEPEDSDSGQARGGRSLGGDGGRSESATDDAAAGGPAAPRHSRMARPGGDGPDLAPGDGNGDPDDGDTGDHDTRDHDTGDVGDVGDDIGEGDDIVEAAAAPRLDDSTPSPDPRPVPGSTPPATTDPLPPASTAKPVNRPPSREVAGDWVVEVWIDPDWFAEQDTDETCPSPAPPEIMRLRGSDALVGRRSRSSVPDIDCGVDSAVSRRQALLTSDGRRWWVEDLDSSNGTWVAPAIGPLPTTPISGRTEIDPDDRIYVGAWTRLVLRPAVAYELEA